MSKFETKAEKKVSFWKGYWRNWGMDKAHHVLWIYLGPVCIRVRK